MSLPLNGHGFLAGTPVNTPQGLVPIEELQPNDLVVSRNKTDGNFISKPIRSCKKRRVREIIELSIDSNNLQVNLYSDLNQRFYVLNAKRWRAAKNLKPGDLLSKDGGGFAIVKSVRKVKKTADVYYLAIDKCHNFCVSKEEIVAHNIFPFLTSAAGYITSATTYVASTASTIAIRFGLISPVTGPLGIATSFTTPQVLGASVASVIVVGTGKAAYNFVSSFFSGNQKSTPSISTSMRDTLRTPHALLTIRERFKQTNYENIRPPDSNALNPPGPNPVMEMINRWIPNYDSLSNGEKANAIRKAEWLENTAGKAKVPEIGIETNTCIPSSTNISTITQREKTNLTISPPVKSFTPTPPAQTLQFTPPQAPPIDNPKTYSTSYDSNSAARHVRLKKSNSTSGLHRSPISKSTPKHRKRPCHTTKPTIVDGRHAHLQSSGLQGNQGGEIKRITVGVTNDPVPTNPLGPSLANPPESTEKKTTTLPTCTPPSPTEPQKIVLLDTSAKTRHGKHNPHDQAGKKNVELGTKSIVCATGGSPLDPNDPEDSRRGENGKLWNPLNIKPKTESKHEKTYIPQATSVTDVQTEVLSRFADDLNIKEATPYVSVFEANHVCHGKIAGMQWDEGKVVWRIDFDPTTKGAHFNFSDCRSGNTIKLSIPLSGGQSVVESYLALFNSPENLAAAMEMYNKKIADGEFEKKHPTKIGQYTAWVEALAQTLKNIKTPTN